MRLYPKSLAGALYALGCLAQITWDWITRKPQPPWP